MKVFLVLALSLGLLAGQADAKGSSSSGGHSSGGHSSSGGRSMGSAPMSAPRPAPAPMAAPAPNPNKGSFSSAPPPRPPQAPPAATGPNGGKGSFNSANAPAKPAAAPTTRTTTTTTTSTSTHTYSGRNVSPGGYYGGWGMGYGYSNGLLTGLIIGNMMHPHGSVMYAGPGMYSNNALLYPNGQVVNQQGVLVGTYANGTFNPISNGQVVAQAVPQDVQATPVAPQPVTIVKAGPSFAEVFAACVLGFMIIIVFLAIIL